MKRSRGSIVARDSTECWRERARVSAGVVPDARGPAMVWPFWASFMVAVCLLDVARLERPCCVG